MPDNGWDRCEDGLHITICNAFPFPMFDGFDMVYRVLSIPDMMWGMSYQWPEDVGLLLDQAIGNCTPAGHYGPKRGVLLYGSWVTLRILG